MNTTDADQEWDEALQRGLKTNSLDDKRKLALWEAQKELATRSLHEFVRQAWHLVESDVEFIDNWHIHAVCDHLEAVSRGELQQLIINVPPGTMKSLLVCVFWPAWRWIENPGKRFMFSSYAEALSLRDSIKTRMLIRSRWYQERWPLEMTKEQDSRLENAKNGWRIVGSIGGKGIGEHPDHNVADDPHNVLQAESDADRQSVTRWFEGVFCVRGEVRDASRVLVMQRLHSEDCTGTAIQKGGWAHLCLPMQWEPDHPTATSKERPTPIGFIDPRTKDGELLWPEAYSATKVAKLENNMGVYVAAGQLQQRPSPRGGGMFKRDWFEVQEEQPRMVRVVRFWDKAATGQRKGGKLLKSARTAGVAMGLLRGEPPRYIILDVKAGRWSVADRERIIKETAKEDEETWRTESMETSVEQEPGSGGKESADSTITNLDGYDASAERPSGSKEVRAEPLASAASVGRVRLLQGLWNKEFLDELEMFPMGSLKDQVDGASGAYNKLARPRMRIGGLFHVRARPGRDNS